MSGADSEEQCYACDGTGIEEGQEWNGTPCSACLGKGWIPVEDEDYDPYDAIGESRFGLPGGGAF